MLVLRISRTGRQYHAREAIRVSVQSGRPLHEVQHQMLDCHYGDFGAMLLANWKLPAELQDLIRYHPDPSSAPGVEIGKTILTWQGIGPDRIRDPWTG